MNLTKRDGNVYMTPDSQPPPAMPDPDGTRPSWDFDSETNAESWKDILFDMGRECKEVKAREKAQRKLAATPKPVDAWVTSDDSEIILVMADDTSHIIPARFIAGRGFESLFPPKKAVWAVWDAHRETMKSLGFNKYKAYDGWKLTLRDMRRRPR